MSASGSAASASSSTKAPDPYDRSTLKKDTYLPWISMLVPPDRIGLTWRHEMAREARGQKHDRSAAAAEVARKRGAQRLSRKTRPVVLGADAVGLYHDVTGPGGEGVFADSARTVLSSGRVTEMSTDRSRLTWYDSARSNISSSRDTERMKEEYALAVKKRLKAEVEIAKLSEQLESIYHRLGSTQQANPSLNLDEMDPYQRHELFIERTMNRNVGLEANRRMMLARAEASKAAGDGIM